MKLLSYVSEAISAATKSIKRNKQLHALRVSRNLQRHRAVSLRQHGFLVLFAVLDFVNFTLSTRNFELFCLRFIPFFI